MEQFEKIWKNLGWMIAAVIIMMAVLTACLINMKEKNRTAEESARHLSVQTEEKTAANEDKPKIAITFDDGPHSQYTPMLLDGLKERGVKATFFLIGKNAEKNVDLVRRIDAEGHLIGNHTYNHVAITNVSNETAYREIMDTDRVVYDAIGKHTEYVRPPFGTWQKDLELGMETLPVMWTIDPLDWTTENVDEIVNRVVTKAEENDIILLHDCYESSVKAALRIIDILEKEGFQFVTVDEMLLD